MCKKFATQLPKCAKPVLPLLPLPFAPLSGLIHCPYVVEIKRHKSEPGLHLPCPFGQSIALHSLSFNLSADGEWKLKKVLLLILGVLVLALACGSAVLADTVDDPLHGACNGTGSGTCSDNGTNTPLGNSTTFGFTISPGPQTGDLFIDILVPTNYAVPGSFTINFANNTLAGTATELPGQWTSGTLASFIGIGASPNNPIGAYLPSAQIEDPGATGFFVFQADIGTLTMLNPSGAGTAAGTFNMISGLGGLDGSYIVGFCGTGCTGNANPYVATANSGALLVTPEPSSLLMLGAGLLALAALTGRRSLTV